MKVFILTEGGKKAGFGHVARCCALYDAFEEKGVSPELIINGDSSISTFLKGRRYKIFNWLKDRGRLSAAISNAGIVIVDSYLAGLNFYKKISCLVKIPVYLDDNRRLKYPRGIIINAAVYAEKLPYSKRDNNRYLLGTLYTPLQKAFWKVAKKRINKKIKSILVTFGGAKADELIIKVSRVLASKYPTLDKKIVVGKKLSAEKMKKLMMRSDIAISGGGQTLYELARVGVPTIAVATAENQLNNIKGWERKRFIKYAGRHYEKNLPDKLAERIENILDQRQRVRMSRQGMARMDGKGALRLVEYILKAGTAGKGGSADISLRGADKNDCHDLWLWRNDPRVRARSFSRKRISYKDHEKWFRNKLGDSSTEIFIAQNSSLDKIGQVRFDTCKGQLAYVNVNLNPLFFGKGFGSLIIEEATKVFIEKRSGVGEIIAEVIDSNEVSKKAFLKAGYVFSHDTFKKNINVAVFKFRNNNTIAYEK